jgi:ABC-2 type transport system permease protein
VTAFPNLNGWIRHLLLTIALNFASPQAIVYGYLVPVFFLLAFGSVFRTDSPPLQAHMGQILTITILGGACFGLPTALVSEREQGVWRRYRLLPIPVAWLVLSAMIARVLIVASAVLIQIALARAVYGTPLPTQPGIAVLAFFFVTAAFLALGLLIAALADTVPAVQALGQCIFLPMIMIGGVGVPLTALPDWAQHVAGFMPGRYAVEVLQPCFDGRNGLPGAGFRLGALGVIGLAAGVAAARLFRWEAGARIGRPARLWVATALAAWISVGAVAWQTGRLKPILPEAAAWTNITEAQIAEIRFDNLPGDHDLVAPLAASTLDLAQAREFAAKLGLWPQGKLDDSGQSIRNLVSIAAVADLCADPRESEIARLVFRQLKSGFEPAVARQGLAWIILSPEDGQAITKAPELGLFRHPPERLVRQRSVIYAEKYLGRLLGKIPD